MNKVANALLALSLLASTLPALADNPKNPTNIPNHPRVNQVNTRVKNQHGQIKNGLHSGKLTQVEAAKLHKQRLGIKGEEHAMRKSDNGHLTKGDQKLLNHQLNHREGEIKKDEAKNTGH